MEVETLWPLAQGFFVLGPIALTSLHWRNYERLARRRHAEPRIARE